MEVPRPGCFLTSRLQPAAGGGRRTGGSTSSSQARLAGDGTSGCCRRSVGCSPDRRRFPSALRGDRWTTAIPLPVRTDRRSSSQARERQESSFAARCARQRAPRISEVSTRKVSASHLTANGSPTRLPTTPSGGVAPMALNACSSRSRRLSPCSHSGRRTAVTSPSARGRQTTPLESGLSRWMEARASSFCPLVRQNRST